MSNLKKVHEHLGESARAHRQAHEDALRQAAVARAQAEAAGPPDGGLEPSPTTTGEPADDDSA